LPDAGTSRELSESPTARAVLSSEFFKSLSATQQRLAKRVLHDVTQGRQRVTEDIKVETAGTLTSQSPSQLVKVYYLNLDRRVDRASEQQERLRHAGLDGIAERIRAVDGKILDLDSVSERVLTADGRSQAKSPPAFVLGRVLTPGAVGLWLSWYKVLRRIAKQAAPNECFMIAEDDAEYFEDFCGRLEQTFEALDSFDPHWHGVCLGYIKSKSRVKPLLGDKPEEGTSGTVEDWIGRPGKLCGASAVIVRGKDGAHAFLNALFPVGPDQQLDLKISNAAGDWRDSLHLYMAASPLAAAPLSEAGDSDIQRIPEERRLKLQMDAKIRHAISDTTKAGEDGIGELWKAGKLAQMKVQLGADEMSDESFEDLLNQIAKSYYYMSRDSAPKVRWSLKESFSLVGSWDNWSRFTELKPYIDDSVVRSAEVPVTPGGIEEFQILVTQDWNRRFYPMHRGKGAAILGPNNRHGLNWAVPVPATSNLMSVEWDPSGMRSVSISFRPGLNASRPTQGSSAAFAYAAVGLSHPMQRWQATAAAARAMPVARQRDAWNCSCGGPCSHDSHGS